MDINTIPKKRNVFLFNQIDQDSVEKVTKEIIEINDSDEFIINFGKLNSYEYTPEPINLYIDSYGGNVYQTLGLISIVEKSKTPIHTICTGTAMSGGFLLLINGHKRFGYRYSTPLYHQASSSAFGELKHIEDDVDETRRLQKIIEKMVLEKTKISKEMLKQVYKEKLDWYMSAQEALKLNVIDEIK